MEVKEWNRPLFGLKEDVEKMAARARTQAAEARISRSSITVPRGSGERVRRLKWRRARRTSLDALHRRSKVAKRFAVLILTNMRLQVVGAVRHLSLRNEFWQEEACLVVLKQLLVEPDDNNRGKIGRG